MARTTSAAVGAVLGDASTHTIGAGDWDGVRSLTPFIDAATVIVTRVATCATARSRTLSSTELELIERWLAAHFYAMSDQTYASKSTGGASASFHGQTGMNLDATKYGQTAKTIDFSGCLTAIASRRTARARWLGKPQSQQTDYVQRD